MPKPKKSASEMTDEELARRLFPKKLKEELDKVVQKNDAKPIPESPCR